jgi:UDP-N-acetylmuramate dehydrogenase
MDLRKFIKDLNGKTPFSGSLKFNEPMSRHTTFKTGGPADLWVRPGKRVFITWTASLLKAAEAENIPVFILGKGANLLVSDKGIRGIILDTGSWKGARKIAAKVEEGGKGAVSVHVLSGTSVDWLIDWLAARRLSGLEFLAGMPGSVGGALWMNARCYEKSVSDGLIETEILDENRNILSVPFRPEDFAYKKSPFQNRKQLLLSARFRVGFLSAHEIKKETTKYRRDRKEKGQYRYPSAGSAFKNNQAFGEPTGKIIADLGLRGLRKGGAAVAPWHGNFIINTGGASSTDIRFLMDEVAGRVKEERGLDLEPEIIFAGEW